MKQKEPKEISGWEAQLKDYMVDLIDEYFPKDNQDHPERQSTTHRSEAMVSHALFLVKAREIIQKVEYQAEKNIIKEIKKLILDCFEVIDNQYIKYLKENPDEANGYSSSYAIVKGLLTRIQELKK